MRVRIACDPVEEARLGRVVGSHAGRGRDHQRDDRPSHAERATHAPSVAEARARIKSSLLISRDE
jgi:hypothetical protein